MSLLSICLAERSTGVLVLVSEHGETGMLYIEKGDLLSAKAIGMRNLKNDGMTMMIVTHEIRFAKEVSDKISFLHEGRVIESGFPDDIIDNPKEIETIKFLERSLK